VLHSRVFAPLSPPNLPATGAHASLLFLPVSTAHFEPTLASADLSVQKQERNFVAEVEIRREPHVLYLIPAAALCVQEAELAADLAGAHDSWFVVLESPAHFEPTLHLCFASADLS
jgi:hypothetical protein